MEDAYVLEGEEIHMKCECMAFPIAEIIWSFQPCQQPMLWPHCREMKTINTVSNENLYFRIYKKALLTKILHII
jgi:hypothetical protein